MDSRMSPVYRDGSVMALGHFEAWESIISFTWATFTAFKRRGNCPVEAAINEAIIAIEVNFDRPTGFSPCPQPTTREG
jgi:hypothetical protein